MLDILDLQDTVEKDLANALDTTEGSTGDVLIPRKVDAGIRKYVETYSPLYALMPRKKVATKYHEYIKVVALPTAKAGVEGTVAPTSKSRYEKAVVQMRWITSTGEVTGPEIDSTAGNGELEAWALEIENHTQAVINEVERLTVAGDSAVAGEFDGLMKAITQAVDGESKVLTLGMLDAGLMTPKARPTHILASDAHQMRLWSLLQAQQRFVDRTEVEGGFSVPSYGGAPIITPSDDAAAAMGDTILMPDFKNAYLAQMRDLTFEKLAKIEDSERFYIRMYAALAVEGANRFHSRIDNVLAAPVAP